MNEMYNRPRVEVRLAVGRDTGDGRGYFRNVEIFRLDGDAGVDVLMRMGSCKSTI